MKNRISLSVSTSLSTLMILCGAITAQAGQLEIQWNDPETFRDIQASNNSNQEVFEQNVIASLTRYFTEASTRYLPANQTLTMTVTDVDLAGGVEYPYSGFDNGGTRIVKDLYFPAFDFTYELKDSGGTVLQAGDENIRDMNFLFGRDRVLDRTRLDHERRLIDSWFSDHFGNES